MIRLPKLAVPLLVLAVCVEVPAVAAPAEPLVVTQLPNPDPDYVPPPPEKRSSRAGAHSAERDTIEGAMENLGRVAGQIAASVEQRAKSDPEWEAQAREKLRKLLDEARASKN